MTLILHVFNTLGGENIKAFHVPALLSCICSFYLVNKKDKLYKHFFYFMIVTLISSFFSINSGSLMVGVTMCIVMMSCIGLSYIDKSRVISLLIPTIPAITTFLLVYAFKEVLYRYQGFYNDPNYLCTTLMSFLYISIITFKKYDSKIIKYLQLYNIVIIEALVMLTLSRTGMLCSSLLLFVAFFVSVTYEKIEPFLDVQ